jgi:hypothetical protein
MKDSRFKKYEFDSEQDAFDKIAELTIENEPLPYLGLVKLGFIMTKEGTYDEEGNVITEPTFSDKYSIDVFWKEQEPDGWKGKKIKLNGNTPAHSFAGIEYIDD